MGLGLAGPHHGLEDEAQVAAVLEVAQQADDVALVPRVRGAQLAQNHLLRLPRLVPAPACCEVFGEPVKQPAKLSGKPITRRGVRAFHRALSSTRVPLDDT